MTTVGALALVHAGLGDEDAVFEWLDRAYGARDVHLMFLTVDVKWDRYRADPRFGVFSHAELCQIPTHA